MYTVFMCVLICLNDFIFLKVLVFWIRALKYSRLGFEDIPRSSESF